MKRTVTAEQLYRALRGRLGLSWEEGGQREACIVGDCTELETGRCLVGHLNLIHPCRIQVLDRQELQHLDSLGDNSRDDSLDMVFSSRVGMVIVAGGCEVPEDFRRRAESTATPLLCAESRGHQVIALTQFYLSRELADRVTLHGVFMEVLGVGVLIAGDNGSGKSELALELITRGHRLIADDVAEFTRTNPEMITGSCPELLQDFMEVRGLGVLNVREMFGDSAIRRTKSLGLVVSLEAMDEERLLAIDRLRGSHRTRRVLDQPIPEVTLPVAAGRNLAVLVESAVRNHILSHNGYDAAGDFIERQRREIERGAEGGRERT
ncbi:HPr(Ser) kinase/phosphatase [Endothiovibrio diazotrophicus]